MKHENNAAHVLRRILQPMRNYGSRSQREQEMAKTVPQRQNHRVFMRPNGNGGEPCSGDLTQTRGLARTRSCLVRRFRFGSLRRSLLHPATRYECYSLGVVPSDTRRHGARRRPVRVSFVASNGSHRLSPIAPVKEAVHMLRVHYVECGT